MSKNSTLISQEKLSNCFGWKNRENGVVLGFLAIDNFDFTRKIVKKNLGEKLVKNVGDLHFVVVDNFHFPRKIVKFCQNWIFWTKIWLFDKCVSSNFLLLAFQCFSLERILRICDSQEDLFCSLDNDTYGCTSKTSVQPSCTEAHLCNAPWSLLAPIALGLLIIVVFVLSGGFWCCCCCCGGRCCRQTCPRYVNEYSCKTTIHLKLSDRGAKRRGC